jgi:hypothetical protein
MKKIILTLIFVVMVGLGFTSCTKNDFDYDPTENVTNVYNNAFVKTFGTPAANQTWGFGSSAAVTRGCYPNSNMWASEGYVIPADITSDEVTKVFNAFNEVGEAEYESLVNWDCFFVQHVYGAHSNMDWLYAWDPEGHEETIYGDPANNWQPYNATVYEDHIFNFNATSGSIQLMVNSSTQKFGFHSSQDSKKHPTFRMMKIDGAYYVGFDYYANGENSNQQEARDFVYTDWIVKICPGRGITPPADELRIIAEDLSATDNTDFDFNDVVLDVNIDGTTAYCTLIAAGGTLPLRIAGSNDLEIHKLFGVLKGGDNWLNTKQEMINTGAGPTKDYVPFTLTGISNAADIKLEVYKYGTWIEMTAQQGTPAAKIAVFQDFDYCSERQPITTKYPEFKNWVQDVDYIWW